MKNSLRYLLLLIGVPLVYSFCNPGQTAAELKWYTLEEAEQLWKKEPRKIFVDVYTDWCGWCKKMDRETFTNPKIAEIITKYYYPVKLNAEQRTEITFNGETFSFVPSGNRGYNEIAAKLLNNQLSYPTIAYLDETLKLIQPVPGYQSPQTLEPILLFFGTDAYRNQTWDQFSQNFKSGL